MVHLRAMDKLIFVYNADSGILNSLKDWAHKIISPETYPCSLCTLTYDNLGMRRTWREFIEELECDVEFLHRDEFAEQFNMEGISLPAAFIQQNGRPELWMKTEEMDSFDSLNELQTLVLQKLDQPTG